MPTQKEEEEEQKFFAEQLKQQEQDERKHKMAGPNDKPKGKDAPKAVTSPAGITEPGIELGGDGVTPKHEWDEKYAELKKKQDDFDEKQREKARENTGIIQTTEKMKHG